MAKLWGGRFSKNTNELVDAFNASIEFDKRLYHEDIRGSIAHAQMLGMASGPTETTFTAENPVNQHAPLLRTQVV